MTVIEGGNDGGNRSGGATRASLNLASTYPCKPIKGEGIRWLVFVLDFGWLTWFAVPRVPLDFSIR